MSALVGSAGLIFGLVGLYGVNDKRVNWIRVYNWSTALRSPFATVATGRPNQQRESWPFVDRSAWWPRAVRPHSEAFCYGKSEPALQ